MNNKKYAKVEGHPNLLRDLSTNAIINTDNIGSEQYLKVREQKLQEKKKLSNMESEIEDIKSSINEIKTLLRNIYES
jgi:hypothetical protein